MVAQAGQVVQGIRAVADSLEVADIREADNLVGGTDTPVQAGIPAGGIVDNLGIVPEAVEEANTPEQVAARGQGWQQGADTIDCYSCNNALFAR